MQISDAVKRIQGYLNNSLNLPFFVSVEDGNDYVDLCEKFSGLHIVKVSDYCEEDSQPDYTATSIAQDLIFAATYIL